MSYDIVWTDPIEFFNGLKYGRRVFEELSKDTIQEQIPLDKFFEPVQFYIEQEMEINGGSRIALLFIEAFIERYRQYEFMFTEKPGLFNFILEKSVITLFGRRIILPLYGYVHENTVVQLFANTFRNVLSTMTYHSAKLELEKEKGVGNLMKHHDAMILSFERYTFVLRQVFYFQTAILYLIMKEVPLEDIFRIVVFSSIACSYCLVTSAEDNNIKTTVARHVNESIHNIFAALYTDFQNLSENGELRHIFHSAMEKVRDLAEVRINSVTLMNNSNADTLILKDLLMSIMMSLKPDRRYPVVMEHMTKSMIDLVDVLARLHIDFSTIKQKYQKSLAHRSYPIIDEMVKNPRFIQTANQTLAQFDVFASMEGFRVSKPEGDVLLRPTHLKIRRGHWYFLKGPSGSGKSLIFISAFLRGMRSDTIEYEGRITYFDGTQQDLSYDDLVPYIGHLHLTKNIVQSFTVKQNLLLGIQHDTSHLGEIARLKRLFRIEHVDDDAPVSSCSTGEQQRIQFIRLILQDRAVWIIDEATTNIDRATAEICLRELRRIQKTRNKLIMEITHYHTHAFHDYELELNHAQVRLTKNKNIASYYSSRRAPSNRN